MSNDKVKRLSRVDIVHGVRLLTTSDKVIEQIRKQKSAFEPESIKAWAKYCKTGNLLLDVGAYTGLYTIYARKLGATCYGYEPSKPARIRAQQNLELNGISDPDAFFPFAIGAKGGNASIVSSEVILTSASRMINTAGGSVPVFSLDDLFTNTEIVPGKTINISAIKIDIEGGELDALVGAQELLRRGVPLLIVETLTRRDRIAIEDFLTGFGYKFRFVDGRNLICER